MEAKTLEQYLRLPYRIEVIRDEDVDNPGWVARVVELPGCITQGDTFEELGEMIEDAMRGWLETALEKGIPIPEPRPQDEYSGKFVVRVPRSLHRRLVEEAEHEAVSLNQYINVALAGFVGQKGAGEVPTAEPTLGASAWPGLSEAAQMALRMAGLEEEAGQLDERLFAGWLGEHFSQVESAYSDGDHRNAMRYLDNVTVILRQYMHRSPTLEALVQMLEFQRELLERILQFQRDSARPQTPSFVAEYVQQTFQASLSKSEPMGTSLQKELDLKHRKEPEQYEVGAEFDVLKRRGQA